MQKITPFLWFRHQAEAAAKFYTSIFKNSRITEVARYGEAGPGKKGSVMTVNFEIEGQAFTAMNAPPMDKFNLAISFLVHCQTQKEIDYYWAKLSRGGKIEYCGWLRDKFGVAWQITPDVLLEMNVSKDKAASARAFAAMMKMRKLDIKKLKQAYAGK